MKAMKTRSVRHIFILCLTAIMAVLCNVGVAYAADAEPTDIETTQFLLAGIATTRVTSIKCWLLQHILRLWNPWWFTRRNTETARFGFDRLLCGMRW